MNRASAALCVALIATSACRRADPPRVGTYNIRRMGVEATDLDRLGAVVRSTRADVLALQEIMAEEPLVELERRLATAGGHYAHALSKCGGRSGMRVGFLYDTQRARLVGTREFAGLDPDAGEVCTDGDRSGFVGEFVIAGERVHLMSVHLASGGSQTRSEARRAQWTRAFTITRALRREGAERVVLMGDTNSAGWMDNRHGERDFIEESARAEGMDLASRPLPCSEYWRPSGDELVPSVLDHVVATPGAVRPGTVTVHGYCERLACRAISSREAPEEYTRVSDHCPVTVTLW